MEAHMADSKNDYPGSGLDKPPAKGVLEKVGEKIKETLSPLAPAHPDDKREPKTGE
jgi:hypothetical protein